VNETPGPAPVVGCDEIVGVVQYETGLGVLAGESHLVVRIEGEAEGRVVVDRSVTADRSEGCPRDSTVERGGEMFKVVPGGLVPCPALSRPDAGELVDLARIWDGYVRPRLEIVAGRGERLFASGRWIRKGGGEGVVAVDQASRR